MARTSLRVGVVTAFDDPEGLGEVTDEAGSTFAFHCSAIADGSRTIQVGTTVRFVVVAGHVGLFEAAGLVPA